MKIVIALDSFKESLTAQQACEAVARGFRAVLPNAHYCCLPMADGGEGTTAALIAALGGVWQKVAVHDPLGRIITAHYGKLPDGTAVMEMAEAAGLHLLSPNERDPRYTTTYGVGEMMLHALQEGAQHIILGIGGSATNDGGAGMLQALGVRLLDQNHAALPFGGSALARLAQADFSELSPLLSSCRIDTACDVNNPLCGPNGASHIFGPQKGADKASVLELDSALAHYASILTASGLPDKSTLAGAGAAGGLGYALSLLGAHLTSGITLVMQAVNLSKAIEDATLVITGEGQLDRQTRLGKVPFGVLQLARQHNVPIIAIAGILGSGAETLIDDGFAAIFPSIATLDTLPETLAKGAENLERTARQIAAIWRLGKRCA
ncbi:MAG: glycerate kinase [Cardiobacteriaceae bacterium]|nr:glycerate kinase [Cardiobacteriaceae bacterium]